MIIIIELAVIKFAFNSRRRLRRCSNHYEYLHRISAAQPSALRAGARIPLCRSDSSRKIGCLYDLCSSQLWIIDQLPHYEAAVNRYRKITLIENVVKSIRKCTSFRKQTKFQQ